MTAPPRVERLDELRALVSPRVGIIRSLATVRSGIELPCPPVIYRAVLAHFDFQPATLLDRTASGKGETEEEAAMGAIGEAIERYCASHPDPERFVLATYAGLKGRALDPKSCVLYSENQYASDGFPYNRFHEEATLAWMPALSLPTEEEILVPASLIYLNYPCRRPEEYIAAQTSNGLAAGHDLEAAILGGLYELVERDGFLIHWLNQLPGPRVDLSGLDGLPRSIIAHFRRFGVEVCAFNLSVDIPIPVMMGLLIDRSGQGPAAVVGLGCHLEPAEALRKALMETCQVYAAEIMKAKYGMNRNPMPSFQDVRQPEDHSSWFSLPGALAELAFLL
jgi:ribosomal protein S12 methylthiotransferase accessory factor